MASSWQELRIALAGFVQEICQQLHDYQIPERSWTRIVRETAEAISFPQEKREDIDGSIELLADSLRINPPDGLLRLFKVIRRDPILAGALLADAAGDPIVEDRPKDWALNTAVGSFLRAYLRRTKRFLFNREVFDQLYEQFVSEILSDTNAVTEVNTLVNVQLDVQKINLAPGMVLRKLEANELEEWLNDYIKDPFPIMRRPPIDPFEVDCAIEITYEKGRREAWGARQDIRDKVSDFVTSICLLTDKNVHIGFIEDRSSNILHPGGGTSYSNIPKRSGARARLNVSSGTQAVDIWNRIRELPPNSAIRFALRRWDIVSERFNEDDTLIDYWIAFESLFTPDSSQEVRYRASIRIAAFVGNSPEERTSIFKQLKESYDLRSKIVHGGVQKISNKSGVISNTRSYLRRALLMLVLDQKTFDPISIETDLLKNPRWQDTSLS
ncbi:hypothetical protein Dform_01797 [Dehalogenimonas formicexedens]|uniref:Uncharacterized protein n=2 Tax=Dehalogenimonas formicexedens TaxID=1839801 RepID=A0A1P8F9H3_9CHLR|nr:hypothetical protein Dform_01797 [Dehalogenimonas formicexedens]